MDCNKFLIPEENLKKSFRLDPLDIWINSFGGCRSNYIKNLLSPYYKTYNAFYEYKGCHYYKPIKGINPKLAIFCYTEDVEIALTSQINRKMKHNFYKEIPPHLYQSGFKYSIDNWAYIINRHIINWSTVDVDYTILLLNTDKIRENSEKFHDLTGVYVKGYKSKRSTKKINKDIPDMDITRKKLATLPDFGYLKNGIIYE